MTIAKRLAILVAVPLVVLLGFGVFSHLLLDKVESRVHYAERQGQSLALLGNISRTLTEMRVSVRSYLLFRNDAERGRVKTEFEQDKANLNSLLQRYADTLISDDKDRRLLSDYRVLTAEW